MAFLVAAVLVSRAADTLFTTPVLVVTPTTLKFGKLDSHLALTNTFLLENIGVGKLVGKATVKPPFKIIDGGSYNLRPNEAQVVTVVYLPTSAHSSTNVAKFTGGGGALAWVIGTPTKKFPEKIEASRR